MARSIFITGGASGIGRAVALRFARAGWRVGLADVNEAGMAETAAMLPAGQSSTHRLDVRDRAGWEAALNDFCATTNGRLDVLFNNAGIARGGPFAQNATVDHDLLIDINLRGVVYGAEAGFAWLKCTPGSCLLNTCSASGIYGPPGMAVYGATKFAVRGLTEALDLEWIAEGIKVRALMPGFIDTPLLHIPTAGSNLTAREEVIETGLGFTPVEDVAEAAWRAVHDSSGLHYPVGKTARQMYFAARWVPGFLRNMIAKKLAGVS